MKKSSIDLDPVTQRHIFHLVFESSLAPGLQMFSGAPGEQVFEILTRWLAINAPHVSTVGVKQTSFVDNTWAALDVEPQINFKVII